MSSILIRCPIKIALSQTKYINLKKSHLFRLKNKARKQKHFDDIFVFKSQIVLYNTLPCRMCILKVVITSLWSQRKQTRITISTAYIDQFSEYIIV